MQSRQNVGETLSWCPHSISNKIHVDRVSPIRKILLIMLKLNWNQSDPCPTDHAPSDRRENLDFMYWRQKNVSPTSWLDCLKEQFYNQFKIYFQIIWISRLKCLILSTWNWQCVRTSAERFLNVLSQLRFWNKRTERLHPTAPERYRVLSNGDVRLSEGYMECVSFSTGVFFCACLFQLVSFSARVFFNACLFLRVSF